ncbi:MAG: ribonuclease P protein component [Acholeplasmataceae bacterium]|nr:ribonuclease P protein component [Acholeplasmataceae bacterium]
MNKRYRIKKSSEIDAIFKVRKSKGNAYFLIYQTHDEAQEHFRFALTIGRKYGNAVERNLAKRRIRMIVYNQREALAKNASFIIVVRPASKPLSYQEMDANLRQLFKKSMLLTETKHD